MGSEALKKAYRLFKNTLCLKEPGVKRTPVQLMGVRRFQLFLLHLCVPYWQVARYFLMRAAEKGGPRLPALVESGLVHPALRYLTPEERERIATACFPGTGTDAIADGYAKLGEVANAQECADVVQYLKGEKGFISQVPMQSDGHLYSYPQAEAQAAQQGRYFAFAPSTSLKHPVIARLIDNAALRGMVQAHLGPKAVLNSVNTFVVFPGEAVDHYVMRTHRDYDDFRCLAFFVFWTAVAADNGATMYHPRTHVSSAPELLEHKVFMEGAPGNLFVMDGFGFHSGNNRVKTPRFVTWIRFGLPYNLSVADGWPVSEVRRLL